MSEERVVLLYHYFYPDNVISARLFADLAIELSSRGYAVTAMPSVRSCHERQAAYRRREKWTGGDICRVWRPAWKQATNKGRLGNALFVLAAWTWRALSSRRHGKETVIIGTDPILGVLAAIPWKLFRPKTRIIHWCHDLYPHAAVSDGLLQRDSLVARTLDHALAIAYRRCDVIVDLGPCMRQLLVAAEGHGTARNHGRQSGSSSGGGISQASERFITVTPWSLVEPERVVESDTLVRKDLFGQVALGLLYSGNLGRAHEFAPFVELARAMRSDSVAFCIAGRGPRMEEMQAGLEPDDTNVRFAGFAPEAELEKRLAAADIHLVSLRGEWTGTVVPSKFFGALAAGRPVLFTGSAESAIAQWIKQYRVGWLLTKDNVAEVAAELRELTQSPGALAELNAHCHRVYQDVFSKRQQIAKMVAALKA